MKSTRVNGWWKDRIEGRTAAEGMWWNDLASSRTHCYRGVLVDAESIKRTTMSNEYWQIYRKKGWQPHRIIERSNNLRFSRIRRWVNFRGATVVGGMNEECWVGPEKKRRTTLNKEKEKESSIMKMKLLMIISNNDDDKNWDGNPGAKVKIQNQRSTRSEGSLPAGGLTSR